MFTIPVNARLEEAKNLSLLLFEVLIYYSLKFSFYYSLKLSCRGTSDTFQLLHRCKYTYSWSIHILHHSNARSLSLISYIILLLQLFDDTTNHMCFMTLFKYNFITFSLILPYTMCRQRLTRKNWDKTRKRLNFLCQIDEIIIIISSIRLSLQRNISNGEIIFKVFDNLPLISSVYSNKIIKQNTYL